MPAKKIGHIVTRPGLSPGDEPITIPVANDLETAPGIPINQRDVDFYTREYPLESYLVSHTANLEWLETAVSDEELEHRKEYAATAHALVDASIASGDIPPTGTPEPGKDLTEEIRAKGRELGYGEIGFAKFDRRYVFENSKTRVAFPHAICVAMETDYERTQMIPSMDSELAHHECYEILQKASLALADYIRSLGYRAAIHGASDPTLVNHPMFVEAGLGQMGANGQLLSPHFGSRARLMIISTDAPVTYDQPIDYGINRFCEICQVCVNRCPGRALSREKVWFRGVEKYKVTHDRCRPVMIAYTGCAVCMKVCPVQKYGMKPVMEHYVATGEVLGKGTDDLEGFSLIDKGYFGPAKMPHFDVDFFRRMPRGTSEDWLFEQFKNRLQSGEIPEGPEAGQVLRDFKDQVKKYLEKKGERQLFG